MKLINYSHDRNANFKKSSDELFDLIEKFGEEKKLESFFNHYEDRYSIPKKVLKQSLKHNIAQDYRYSSSKFGEKFRLLNIAPAIAKFFGFLLLSLIYSRKKIYNKHYKLIVDEINMSRFLHRYIKLINLFGKENVLVIATEKMDVNKFPDYKIKRLKLFKYHDRFEVLKVIYYELFFGFWICLKTSIQVNLNLFQESISIIKTLIQYKSLFKSYSADYLFQERLYTTNAIKNHFFKESGGIATSTMQKSILEICKMSYYIDSDYFFCLGNCTAENAFHYGARIDHVIPVGSMFMDYYWFSNPKPVEKNIDVIYLGLNVMNAYERQDKYTEFMDDYYSSIRWLVKFKKEYPSLRVGIKHHASAGVDDIENKIISDSGVELFEKTENSYNLGFQSRCVVTWGSTMGYEMGAHGVPSFFLDPGNRNSFLYDLRNKKFQHLLLDNYDDFHDALILVLNKSNKQNYDDKEFWNNLCFDSSNASQKIFDVFSNKLDYK